MSLTERLGQQIHPEGLTEEQERLLDHLFEIKIRAPVRRREELNGVYRFTKDVRDTHPIDFALEGKGEFALKDHEKNPSAPLSPVLLNLRDLPEELELEIGKNLADIKLGELPDFCTGVPRAGRALAEAYSKYSGIPFRNVFDKGETNGKRKIIIRPEAIEYSGKLLIIDDAISEGHSALEAVNSIKNASHIKISNFLFVADREQGGADMLKTMGYRVYFLYTFKSQILPYGLRKGKINQSMYDKAVNYFASFKQ